nr:YqjK-like family protein [uncultured Methylotenera sp.]
MSPKRATIAERREKLILKAATQRVALAQDVAPLGKPLTIAYRGFQLARYVRQHPILMLGVTTAISVIRPARVLKWLKTGFSALNLARSVSDIFIKK